MGSDHCPVSCYLKLNDKPLPLTASLKPRVKFQGYFTGRSWTMLKLPLVSSRTGKELPSSVVNLIKQKRAIAKNLKVSSNTYLRRSYNELNSEVRKKITKYKEKSWETFLEKHWHHPVMAKPFWKEINKAVPESQ
jgi:hypothetical protein